MAGLFNQARIHQMVLAARHGEVAPYLTAARELAGRNLSGDLSYNLACFFALASSPNQGSGPQIEEHAVQAIRLLSRSLEKGFLREPFNLAHARKDEDLKLLRQRGDFQQLLKRAEEKRKSTPAAASKPKVRSNSTGDSAGVQKKAPTKP
jgi:hypothetical protein